MGIPQKRQVHRKRSPYLNRMWILQETPGTSELSISIPGAEKRIVVYFTSLRVVRSTFEDCRTVRSILRGFRVSLDERDLSMDSCFLEELQGILGQNKLTVPRVFIGGRYIGGAEEIRQLHEIGELKKYVEGLPAAEPGVCDVCGGYRFILCDNCNGSHKLYFEKGGFRSCADCNENESLLHNHSYIYPISLLELPTRIVSPPVVKMMQPELLQPSWPYYDTMDSSLDEMGSFEFSPSFMSMEDSSDFSSSFPYFSLMDLPIMFPMEQGLINMEKFIATTDDQDHLLFNGVEGSL
ncbi:hypothetical protein L1049_013412 [Liquidambar formosana]|uniref:Glutaredoxin domain-containing protein n=1 Tax=Liquidambar formosana TaxID=63359 RepID=A0AAP0WYD2_LIQFO